MSQLVRFTLIVFAFVLAVFSVIMMMMMMFDPVYAGVLDVLIALPGRASSRIIATIRSEERRVGKQCR